MRKPRPEPPRECRLLAPHRLDAFGHRPQTIRLMPAATCARSAAKSASASAPRRIFSRGREVSKRAAASAVPSSRPSRLPRRWGISGRVSPEPQPVSLHRTAPAMRASPQKRSSGKKSGYTRISRQAGARTTRRRRPDFRDVSPLGGRTRDNRMPPKIRELVGDLERAGFANRGGKGSHRNFVHPRLAKPITISGRLGDDARRYQVRAVRRAIEESRQ